MEGGEKEGVERGREEEGRRRGGGQQWTFVTCNLNASWIFLWSLDPK